MFNMFVVNDWQTIVGVYLTAEKACEVLETFDRLMPRDNEIEIGYLKGTTRRTLIFE